MTLQPRERRFLVIWAVCMALGGVYYFVSNSSPTVNGARAAVAPAETIDHAQKRLAYLRSAEATLAGKQTLLDQAKAELATREKGLLQGDSASQAQAQLLQVLQRVAAAQNPPLQMRQTELGQPTSFGENYGLVTVSVTLDARIDDMVNFLAGLNAQPEALATEDLRFGAAQPKLKTMPVRLTVSGVVPRRLIPQRKGTL
jgi:Type II secretion system (T2SS), protein M subtype b